MNDHFRIAARLARVFPYDAADKDRTRFLALIAQMSVAFEDLRVESIGIFGGFGDPSSLQRRTRLLYFMRRSFVSLQVFRNALRLLNDCAEFAPLKSAFNEQEVYQWEAAVAHFLNIRKDLNDARNQVGGHFGTQDAERAMKFLDLAEKGRVRRIDPAVAEIEIDDRLNRGEAEGEPRLRLHFAAHLAAAAALPPEGLDEGSSSDDGEPVSEAFQELVGRVFAESMVQATRAMILIGRHWLVPQFRRAEEPNGGL